MKTLYARPEHEVAYQELLALIARHKHRVSPKEILAISANVVGKVIALQDQRTTTLEEAMQIVMANIERGNEEAVEQLKASAGRG